jgi:hypothetical protein
MEMRLYKLTGVLALSLVLAGSGFAQTNVEENHETQKQLKQEHKSDKAQAKADKDERKAMNTKEQKKADKAQDKADREATKTAAPPQ